MTTTMHRGRAGVPEYASPPVRAQHRRLSSLGAVLLALSAVLVIGGLIASYRAAGGPGSGTSPDGGPIARYQSGVGATTEHTHHSGDPEPPGRPGHPTPARRPAITPRTPTVRPTGPPITVRPTGPATTGALPVS